LDCFIHFFFKAAKVQNIKGTTFFERTAEISSYGTNLNKKKYLGKVATMKKIFDQYYKLALIVAASFFYLVFIQDKRYNE
jgi:hypothetical protein